MTIHDNSSEINLGKSSSQPFFAVLMLSIEDNGAWYSTGLGYVICCMQSMYNIDVKATLG